MFRWVSVLVLTLLTAACATVSPSKLGISQSQWDQYSDTERQQILQGYQQAQRQKVSSSAKSDSVLQVNIQEGKVTSPPFTDLYVYQPLSFSIQMGDCHKRIPVSLTDSRKKAALEACYINDTLYLDPSVYEPAKAIGSLQFPYMPMWKRGFTYPDLSSSGRLKLTHANVTVQETNSSD